jgi:NADPH-ferrihemoprotein reductase
MATDVRNITLNVIKTNGKLSDTDAQQYIKKMEAQKRYSADVWS